MNIFGNRESGGAGAGLLRSARGILLVCFFLSGLTALLYEIVWVRIFGQVFGNTVYSAAAVLGAFMGGLGAGGWWGGRFAERRGDAARVYGLLEIFIGLYALAPLWMVSALESCYPAIYAAAGGGGSDGGSAVALTVVKTAAALAILFLPTFCMGATLPLMSRFFVERLSRFGGEVSLLYGVNTAGAVAGALLTGFVLVRYHGIHNTLMIGMALNVGTGLLAVAQHRKVVAGAAEAGDEAVEYGAAGEKTEEVTGRAGDVAARPVCDRPWHPGELSGTMHNGELSGSQRRMSAPLLLGAAFVAGYVSLSMEVAWTRALSLIIGSTTYSFTLMLVTFLLGISLGSLVAGRMFRARPEFARERSASALGACFLCAAVSTAAALPMLQRLLFWFGSMLGMTMGNYSLVIAGQFAVCSAALFIPALLFGALFPLTATLFSARTGTVASGLGRVYVWNTLGAIAGSMLTGFVLVPRAGVHSALVSGVAVMACAGAALTVCDRSMTAAARCARIAAAAAIVAACAAGGWDRKLMTSGPYYGFESMERMAGLEDLRKMTEEEYELLYYNDGLSATVTVRKYGERLGLQINGKTNASTEGDVDTQLAVGLLPLLLHAGEPRDVAVIGLGCGMSAGAALQVSSVRRVDVVEIEAGVVEALKYFDEYNFGLRHDERYNIYVEDGRNYFLARPQKYDVIISEPSNHWVAGVASLYTQDFYRTAAARLNPGGVFSQWIQAYSLAPRSMSMIMGTFASVFPNAHVFLVGADLVMVGSVEPLEVNARQAALRFTEADIAGKTRRMVSRLDDYGITVAHYIGGPAEVARLAGDSPLNTDDRPELEFAAPFEYFAMPDEVVSMLEAEYPLDLETRLGLDRAPLAADDYFGIGREMMFVKTGVDKAEYFFIKVLEQNPRHAGALALMSDLLAGQKRYGEAEVFYRRAIAAGAPEKMLRDPLLRPGIK